MNSFVTPAMRECQARKGLVPVAGYERGAILAFYLKESGTRMGSTLILFTPEGIALMGDLTPERNGTVSCLGYGIEWFSKTLGEDYLCSKFLAKGYVPEKAKAELLDPKGGWWPDDEDSGPTRDAIRERLREIAGECEEHQGEWLYEQLIDLDIDCSDGVPGWGYDPSEAGWLCAIQQRFAELWAQKEQAQ